jgi:hypothetical protein
VGVTADAVLGEQAIAVQVADGSVEPGPGWRPSPRWGVADQLGDGHAVAHHLSGVRRVGLTGPWPGRG